MTWPKEKINMFSFWPERTVRNGGARNVRRPSNIIQNLIIHHLLPYIGISNDYFLLKRKDHCSSQTTLELIISWNKKTVRDSTAASLFRYELSSLQRLRQCWFDKKVGFGQIQIQRLISIMYIFQMRKLFISEQCVSWRISFNLH